MNSYRGTLTETTFLDNLRASGVIKDSKGMSETVSIFYDSILVPSHSGNTFAYPLDEFVDNLSLSGTEDNIA